MTTVMVNDDIHTLIIERQLDMHRKYKMYIRISDIVTVIIQNGIDSIKQRYIFEKYGVNITVSQIIDTLLKSHICKIEELFNIKV